MADTTKLSQLPEDLSKAKTMDEVAGLVVAVTRQASKQIFDARANGQDTEPYVAQDYVLGEKNTRGLSWKLNLMREVSRANFCQMVRVGIHGGNVKILGQQSNINTTVAVYEALAATMEPLSNAAFQAFNDGRKEGDPAVHKVGWVNQNLINAPTDLGKAIDTAREADAGRNAKFAKMVEEKTAELAAFRQTLAPVKATPAPKDPNAPKATRAGKGKKLSDAEIIANAQAAQNGTTAAAPETTEAVSSTEDATATATPVGATA